MMTLRTELKLLLCQDSLTAGPDERFIETCLDQIESLDHFYFDETGTAILQPDQETAESFRVQITSVLAQIEALVRQVS
jgi:hypothetical protein